MSDGVLITFEGGEGSGKSTQIAALRLLLEENGLGVVSLREPGGTAIGERLRAVVLDPACEHMTPETELLLYEAARSQLFTQVIGPALANGNVVLCDRFTDSTVAYQGFGRGLDLGLIARLNTLVTNGREPDRTIVLDVDVKLGLQRATQEGADRLEMAGEGFHDRVHAAFNDLAQAQPQRVRRVLTQPRRPDTACAIYHELADLFPQIPESQARRAYGQRTPFFFKGHEE